MCICAPHPRVVPVRPEDLLGSELDASEPPVDAGNQTHPGPLGERPELLTTEPPLQPNLIISLATPHSTLNLASHPTPHNNASFVSTFQYCVLPYYTPWPAPGPAVSSVPGQGLQERVRLGE